MSSQTFEKLVNGVRSSKGFSVKAVDRYHDKYETPSAAVLIPVDYNEIDGRKYVLADIEQGILKWEPPLDRFLTAEEKEQLRQDLQAAYEFQGYIVEIDPEMSQLGKHRNEVDPTIFTDPTVSVKKS